MFDEVSDIRLSMDLGSCFKVFGEWLECLLIYKGLLLSLRYGWYISFARSNVTSRKFIDFELHFIVIDKLQSLNTLTICFFFLSISVLGIF